MHAWIEDIFKYMHVHCTTPFLPPPPPPWYSVHVCTLYFIHVYKIKQMPQWGMLPQWLTIAVHTQNQRGSNFVQPLATFALKNRSSTV